ncbi:MAG: hypothetical protein LBM09_02315 [Candidatus Nomurabacteria bacterium]|jgi:hypothetical protein|nr:hypothetical protein [Candidatus Nomurabacteria bacterium]
MSSYEKTQRDQRFKQIAENTPNLPLVSDDANFTLGFYKTYNHCAPNLTEADLAKSVNILKDFCHDDFPMKKHPIYDAVAMGEIGNNVLGSLYSSIAKQALKSYHMYRNKHSEYVFTLLNDQIKLRQSWQKQMDTSLNNELITDPQIWLASPQYITPDGLLNSVKNINLEAVLIQSSQTLAWIRNRLDLPTNDLTATDNSPEMLRQITLAQSLLAPLCELMAYDGLAMALNSAAFQARLQNSGNAKYIDQARERLKDIRDPEQVIQKVSDSTDFFVGSGCHDLSFNYDAERHGILFGEGLCEPDCLNGKTVGVRWRRKGTGQLAWKMYQNEINGDNEATGDDIGITYIMDNDDDMTKVFEQYIERSLSGSSDKFSLNINRKDKIKVASSSPSFIDMFRPIIERQNVQDQSVIKQVNKAFRDVKIRTIDGDNVPFEAQLATNQDRKDNRIGPAAHIFYKQGHNPHPEDLNNVEWIWRRREHIGSKQLISASVNAAQLLIGYIRKTNLTF